MGKEDMIKIVDTLNSQLYDKCGETESSFWYKTNGFVDVIGFDEINLWDSEGDGREYDENNEQEPLIDYVRGYFRKLTVKYSKFAKAI